jgi:hypothetical protein
VSDVLSDLFQQLSPMLATAMGAVRLGDHEGAAELVVAGIGRDPVKQYAAACLLGRIVASQAPCAGEHDGPCAYTAYVSDRVTGALVQWDDVSKTEMFTLQFVMAMLHLDAKKARELYLQALKDGCFAEGFMGLLVRAAQSADTQSITWH